MYPIYCGHQIIEKIINDTGDLVINCVTCHSTAMWHRSAIPPLSKQKPFPRLVGVLKTGLFAIPLEKLIYQQIMTKEEFRKNVILFDIEQKFLNGPNSIKPTIKTIKRGDI